MMDDFSEFQTLQLQGVSAQQAYLIAQANDIDFTATIRMLRKVFNLSLIEAKEITVVATGEANSLMEYQERLIPALEILLASLEEKVEKADGI